ncbi:MAG: hypothetical protein KA436_01750 [Oligoflexales bacterium]|nr:hypothetical protein [Oligoflexales bacterium]
MGLQEKRQSLLVLNNSDIATELLLSHIMNPPHSIELTCTSNLQEFKILIHTASPDVIFIACRDQMSAEMILCLKESRNISFNRDVQVLCYFQHRNDEGIRQALMAGVLQIYVEPIIKNAVSRDIHNLFSKVIAANALKAIKPVKPFPVKVQVYGRVGCIPSKNSSKKQWIVESFVKFSSKETVHLQHAVFENHHLKISKATVLEVAKKDLFYKYSYSYKLDIEKYDPLVLEASLSSETSTPKIKVLWITENDDIVIDRYFDKEQISLYTLSKKLSEKVLNRIYPHVIVFESGSQQVFGLLDRWHNENYSPDRQLLNVSNKSNPNWIRLETQDRSEISKKIRELEQGPLAAFKLRFSSDYSPIKRKSKISRMSFLLEAKVHACSLDELEITVPNKIASGAIVRFTLNSQKNHPYSFFARIVNCVPQAGGTHQAICSIVPSTQNPMLAIPRIGELIDEPPLDPPYRTSVVIPKEFRRQLNRKTQIIFLLVCMVLMYLIATHVDFHEFKKIQEGEMGSIHNAADSIRKSFKAPPR